MLSTEIEGKKRWEMRAENLQQNYFASINELKQDIFNFKSNMFRENERLKNQMAARGLSVADLRPEGGSR